MPSDAGDGWGIPTPARRPTDARRCYVCGRGYAELHPFYEALCTPCGDDHLARRKQRVDLTGKTALVTGGRTGVGFEVVLRLLRDGARVIATTRFPVDAAVRFGRELDFARWHDRLRLRALDCADLPSVRAFAEGPVDLFVHHAAARSAVKPVMYAAEHDVSLAPSLAACVVGEPVSPRMSDPMTAQTVAMAAQVLLQTVAADGFVILVHRTDGPRAPGSWPTAQLDVIAEMARGASWGLHRALTEPLAERRIWLHTVDAGWISDDQPLPRSTRTAESGLAPPLDALDGATRVLDPVWRALSGKPTAGKLWRDYREAMFQ